MRRLARSPIRAAVCTAVLVFPAAWSDVHAQEVQDARAPLERVVSGRVLDETGAVLPRAAVSLRSATGFERLALSDAQGRFRFEGIGAVEHTLSCKASGFAATTRVLAPGETGSFDLTLRPAPVVEEVTVVSGSRQEELRQSLDTKVDVVSAERMRDTGYETVGEVLRELPGVVTRRGSETAPGAGEQIQGIESRQVLVLLDGQPLVGARGVKRGGVLNLDHQSVGRLDRVEVVKGTSSALYGSDAIGGVVNLVTREPERALEGGLALAGGSRGSFDARGEGGFAAERFSAFGFVQRHAIDGFDLTPTTPDMTGGEEDRTDAFAKLRYQAGENVTVSALLNGYWNDASGRVLGEEGLQTSQIQEDSQNYGLNLDWRLAPRTSLQARGYFARFDELSDGALVANQRVLPRGELYQRLGKADASLSQVVGERQLLQAGFEYWHDEYSGLNRLRDDNQGNTATTLVAWGQDRIQLGSRTTLTLGGRLDDHSAFGSAFSPKAAFNVRVSEMVRMRASYGHGYRAPDLGQLFYRFLNPTNIYQIIGNPDLEPERSHSVQLGGELTARGGRARLGVNAFYNDVSNLIDSVNLGFVVTPSQLQSVMEREGIDGSFRPVLGRLLFLYKNIGEARTQGVELDGEAALGAGFSAGAAYTYLDAEDQETGLRLLNRSRHQGFTRVGYEHAGLGVRANLRGTFSSEWLVSRSTTPAGTVETVAPGFAVFDMYASKRLARGLEAYGAIDNLTDAQDQNLGLVGSNGQPLPIYWTEQGRSYRVGVRLWLEKGRPAGGRP